MKKTQKRLLSWLLSAAMLITAVPAVPASAAEKELKPLKLQYKSPANKGDNERNNWERWALPLGNGRMGAMVFGRTDTERIQMNEETLWTGGPGGADDAPGGEYERRDPLSDAYGNVDAQTNGAMDKYIDYLFERYYDNGSGGNDPAQSGDMKILPNHRSAVGDYQNFAELYMDFNHKNTTNYRRELDLRTALSTVTYDYNGVTYTREMFANHPDNVMVYRVTADKPGSIDMTVRPEIPDLGTTNGGHSKKAIKEGTVIADETSKTVTMQGEIVNNDLQFAGLFRVENEGGEVTAQNPEVADHSQSKGQLTIEDADEVTIYVTLGTNYKNVFPDYREDDADYAINNVTARMEAAEGKGYDTLKKNHLADYQKLFSRNELDFGGTYDPEEETDQLLSKWKSAAATGTQNHYLEELYYQYGRYMMIASSREDSLPNNLQGIWNDRAFPNWQSDYHMNINLQMNYWPAFNTDLAECGQALVNYVDSLQVPGALTAEKTFGAENSWVVNCSANPFGYTGNHNSYASLMPTGNAFILQNVYDSYQFTQDKEQLKNQIYPIMTGACNFFLQTLQEGRSEADNDKLFMVPSYSSEQGPKTVGTYFDQQLIYMLFEDTLDAAKELGIKDEFTQKLADTMERLYPIAIGESGQIKEWQQEGEYNRNKYTGKTIGESGGAHRHNSQLMVLHPGKEITTETPEYLQAATNTLNLRGDEATGWSMGQKFNMWARLQDGNHAYDKLFVNLMKNGTATNLFDLHPPFQIDGNFGGTAGLVELLMQSHAGYVSILPALPDALADGSVKGLVAEGNFGINIDWADKAITDLQITSRSGNRLAVKAGIVEKVIDTTTGEVVTDIAQESNGAIAFDTVKGHTYKVVPGKAVDLKAVETLVKEAETIVSYANTTETADEFEEAFMACKRMVEQENYVAGDVAKTTARLTTAIENLVERDEEQYGTAIALKFLENAAKVSYKGTEVEDQWRQQIEYNRADLMEALLAGSKENAEMTEIADGLVKTANKLANYPAERIQLFDLIKTAKKVDQADRTDEEWEVYNDEVAKAALVFTNANATAEELLAAYNDLATLIEKMETVYYVTTSVDGNGTITPNGKVAVLGGTSQKFTAIPDEGYEVLDVQVNGKSVGAVTEYTVADIEKDMTLDVLFQKSEEKQKSEAEILLNNAIAKAESLNKSDYFKAGWEKMEVVLEAAKNTNHSDEAAMKKNANTLLDAIDAMEGWGNPIRTEADSSKMWPVENADLNDQANWGEKEFKDYSEDVKVIGGYPADGPKGGQKWETLSVDGTSNGKQMQLRTTQGSWMKFKFSGDRVRFLAEKALEGAKLQVSIDGHLIDTIDYTTGDGSINPRLNVAFDSADYDLTAKGVDLSKATHELKIVAVEKASSGNRLMLRADAFDEYKAGPIVQTKALAELVAKASALNETAYTSDSWSAMQKSLTAASETLYNNKANQADVNAAKDDLLQKINDLKFGNASEKLETETLLKNAIAKAERLNSADYTKATWNVVAKALEEAKAVLDKDSATMKEKANTLLDAIDKLQIEKAIRTEAESSKMWPVENANPNDQTNWGEKYFKDYPENVKVIAGYPETGPASGGTPWAIASDGEVSNGKQLQAKNIPGTWVKFKFNGDRVRFLATRYAEGAFLDFYVDDILVAKDIEAAGPEEGRQPIKVWFDSADYDLTMLGVDLSEATHELKVVATKKANIGARLMFRVDAFEEFETETMVQTKELAEVIADASSRAEVYYTADTWSAMQKSLETANAVLENNAAVQEEVDAAIKDLREKLDALELADTSISEITESYPITVPYKTTVEELKAKLPTSVVVETVSVKRRVDVKWNLEKFDGAKAGTVALSGEVLIPEDAGINNDNGLKAKVDVIVQKGTATITLGNLEQKDDNVTPVTVTTDPEGLNVKVLYDGSEVLPKAEGTYTVTATVEDDNYEGTAEGTLVINKAWSEIGPSDPVPPTEKPGKDDLQNYYDECKDFYEEDDYSAPIWKDYQDVLEEVEKVLADEKSTEKDYKKAQDALVEITGEMKAERELREDLQKFYDECKAFYQEKNHSKQNWDKYQRVLEEVKSVLGDKNSTYKDFKNALNKLIKITEKLNKELDKEDSKDESTVQPPKAPETVKTGDTTSTAMMLTIMVAMAAVAGVVVFRRKRTI